MKRLLLALLAVALLPGCGQNSSPAGLGWLRAAARAEQTVAWSGELTVAAGAARARVAVEADGQGRQRRIHLDGPCRGLEVIAAGHAEWQRQGQGAWTSRAVLVAPGLHAGEAELARIAQGYRVTVTRAEPVAGRACVRLDLSPTRRGNPSRRVWLDAQTGLTLRTEQHNHRGRLIADTRVTAVDLTARPKLATPRNSRPAQQYPFADLSRMADAAELALMIGEDLPLPSQPPAGYALDGLFVRAARSGRVRPVITLSDGLNVVTLFDRGAGPGHQRRAGRQAPCQIQSGDQANVVTVRRDSREWIAIGDLSERQLRRLAESMP